MKKLFTIITVGLLTVTIWAQSPQKMSYQAVIRNTSNQLVTTQVGMKISVLQGTVSGTPVFVETHTPTPNANGLVTIEIGGGTPVTGTFAAIDWTAGPYFIKTETAIAAPLTTYTIMGTSQLLSVPYALHAKTAATSNDAVKITGDQTVSGNKTFAGTTTVTTPVNATDAATKAYVDNSLKELGLIPNNYSGTVSDIDGNTYKTVTIGTQTWMAENLRVARYKNGTEIPLVTDETDWAALSTPGYCWYNNDEATYKANYGALYNWYTVSTSNLCPTGWHVPTDAEWTTLTTYLGGESVAGGKLKETGTTHWTSPNTGATNESGFTVLPEGVRWTDATFQYLGVVGSIQTSSQKFSNTAWTWGMNSNSAALARDNYDKTLGVGTRCIKD